MKYAAVIESAERTFSAYVTDLPGCIATGRTAEETENEIRSAIAVHLAGLKTGGLPVRNPSSAGEHVEVVA
jgi:predicted RNase H-like HicB family nuclease